MKKYSIMCVALCAAMALASCGSSEKAYRKMYEKAQKQEAASRTEQPAEEVTVVTPVVEKPVTETVVVDNADNVSVRSENLSVVSGSGLKAFSVVVGSFGVKANADAMQSLLKSKGYDAQVAYNSSNRMYRVIASTFDTKNSAVLSRNDLRSQYPDAWLLYNQN